MLVCFNDFFTGKKRFPEKRHSINDSRTTFGSILASFATEIFHECCPFHNTPLPTLHLKAKWSLQISVAFYHVNPYFSSYPTMYNTRGLRIEENTEKNGRIQINACFSSNFLAIFLHHQSSRESSDLF